MEYGHITANFQERMFSNHTPISIEITEAFRAKKRSFRFLNVLADHEEFLPSISSVWNNPIHGTAMYRVWKKLNLCKEPLKQLAKAEFNSWRRE